MTRTQAVLDAIRRELARRQAVTDTASGLAQVTITVKFSVETGFVRGVVWQEEHVERQRDARG